MNKIFFFTTVPGSLLQLSAAVNSAGSTDSGSGIVGRITDFTVSVMEAVGGFGIALLIALENIFPPIPSEVILPLAGFTAAKGERFNIIEAILWATAGSVIGALALYSIARLFGRERTRWFLAKLPFMETSDINKTEAFFEKHERAAVFFGRLLPIFRSLISLPAGVIKMNLPLFIAFTALGSAVWNTALIYAGYILGENWGEVEVYISLISKIIIGAAVLAVLVWAAHKFWLRKKSNP